MTVLLAPQPSLRIRLHLTPHERLWLPTRLELTSPLQPVDLSAVLPLLDHFGVRVIHQVSAVESADGAATVWQQVFAIRGPEISTATPEALCAAFESAFLGVHGGTFENDGLNRLVLAAALDARQVACLRALLRYLIQTGLPYSQAYMEQLLAEQAPIARLLLQLFEARFDPKFDPPQRRMEEIKLAQALDEALDRVPTLDADRVLRAFLSVVRAALRTNYFRGRSWISFKLDPSGVPELPRPLPMYEIFVYAPEVEGVHLRGGAVARGGLRWSDRRQDFRTEVLGLMKAQQVKNTVIVAVGAKGGFVVKRGNPGASPAQRDEWLKTGIECYKTFLRGLLDITDNRVGDRVVPPPDVVRHDGDDPYLVVAADKGTATFSDIANGIAAEYEFWLGDAFASGGSVGYDHKKMGITAKGAWESVKRHFREMNKDIQREPFTVVGIGDMSGDVFGNGLLLSRQARLLAAFDHRHIFIDPAPNAAASFSERERLFALPRSSWDDYTKSVISKGGGVWPRSAKSIALSVEAQKALGVSKATHTPTELMTAILKAPVDLLWNGGIGTYVKSVAQSHADAGDRANDAIRVNGRDLRCKVVGEGGNLGCTQLGRIEYAQAGGRINTDAIDNAGGVHSSDREVNIKIPLNALMRDGTLTRAKRDPLLASLTDDLARAVLRDNYVQSAAVSLLEQSAVSRLDEHVYQIKRLEKEGRLDRAVEFLPDDDAIKDRRAHGQGLTRPELAVLMAYSKMSLFESVLASSVPDDPFFERDLLAYFPALLVQQQPEALRQHRLKREIIATVLSNAVVNRMGLSFAHRVAEELGISPAQVVKAYATAHEIYGGDAYWKSVEALDGTLPATQQYRLLAGASALMKHVSGWLLASEFAAQPVASAVQALQAPVTELEALPDCLSPAYRSERDRVAEALRQDGVPDAHALKLANTPLMASALDIVQLGVQCGTSLTETSQTYFWVGEKFRLDWLHAAIRTLHVQGPWAALERQRLRDDVFRLQRGLTAAVLTQSTAAPAERLDNWSATCKSAVDHAVRRVQDIQAQPVQDFASLAVVVRTLRGLQSTP